MLNVLSDKIRNALGMGIQLDVALPDELPVEEPIQRTGSGFVTQLYATYGVINNTFRFEIEIAGAVQAELQLYDKVKYIAAKDSLDSPFRIIRILSIENDFRCEQISDERIQNDVKEQRDDLRTEKYRSFTATVLQKNGAFLVLNDYDKTEVDLDLAKSNFVPMVGDRLTLTALVEKSDDFVDGAGENVHVKEITWDSMKQDTGSISMVDTGRKCGVINSEFFFYFDVLHGEYQLPCLNDVVKFSAITSDQPDGYEWRCIQVARKESTVPNLKPDRQKPQHIASVGSNVNSYNGESRNARRCHRSDTLKIWNKKRDFIPGRKSAPKSNFVYRTFDSYNVPEKLKNVALQIGTDEVNESLMLICPFQDELSITTYTKCMDYLLYLEEIEMFHNMRRFDMDRAHFVKEGDYLTLSIPNIETDRPAIIIGHTVMAYYSDDKDALAVEGCIHKVFNNKIYLKFYEMFHNKYDGSDYRIEIHFSRLSLRKQHHAIRTVQAQMGEDFLFPKKVKTNPVLQLNVELLDGNLISKNKFTQKPSALKWYNKSLNTIQKEAVKNILRGEARPMPYIVFGPPGTGKTVTLIEAILQLSVNIQNSYMLVATPSNTAADRLLQHIIDSNLFPDGHFVRLVSHIAIERELIPEHLLKYCATIDIAKPGTVKDEMQVTKSGLRLRCNAERLAKYHIIIGTCNTIGTLMHVQFPADHFTHVVVDESGQCYEPEVLIPVTFLNEFTGQAIFAGDPMQLGPLVLSQHARNNGLQTSFLERLLQRLPYQKDTERFAMGYDPRVITQLLYCYRSLPSIVRPFNSLFYNNELRAVISETDSPESELLQKLNDILPNEKTRTPHHGVFFMGVNGENARDANSTSWYNVSEGKHLCRFVNMLYKHGVGSDDIGVITPYQRQVRQIRTLMKNFDIEPPKIGSVEEFQGQERNIILVSTVRSSSMFCDHDDIKHKFSFIMNLKRMNVAISRPRALLMVFGNPQLLAMDSNWHHLLMYCVRNGTYTGVDLPGYLAEDDE